MTPTRFICGSVMVSHLFTWLSFNAFFEGMGRRKVEPERRQQNSQNFLLWAHESAPSTKDGLTMYQTSFVKGQVTESPFCRRYPKHHSEKWCIGKTVPENEKTCNQTNRLNYLCSTDSPSSEPLLESWTICSSNGWWNKHCVKWMW